MDNTQHMCHLHPCLQVLHGADRDIIWLQRDHGLLLVLCTMYAQDNLCLSSVYKPPAICVPLLSVS